MRFLNTLLWVLLAVVVALFASRNWIPVTLALWGDIQADIKLPALLFLVFLLGFLPTYLTLRAKIWGLNRRIEAMDRNRLAAQGELRHAPAVEPHPVPREEEIL